MTTLTIFEGPDCSGKSTLAYKIFQGKNPDAYELIHHGPYPGISRMLPRLYVETMLPMLDRMKNQLWDRAWYSEPIYGDAFRNGEDRVGPCHRRHLERIALRHGAVVVLCLPPWDVVEGKWKERKGQEYLDSIEQVEKVYAHYTGLRFLSHLPIVTFDYTKDDPNNLHEAIELARTKTHPNHARLTAGNWQAKVVLVGDKASELKDEDCRWRAPFSSFSPKGCSSWLTAQLMEARIREDQLLWANAENGLDWLKHHHNQLVVALGEEASKVLAAEDIAHQKVEHPQCHKRFKVREAYPLIEILEEAIGEGRE